jgi:hypothetical protein
MINAAIKTRTNLNTLSTTERNALTKSIYQTPSYFQSLFHCDQTEMDCNIISRAFRQEIERILLAKQLVNRIDTLEKLHESLSDEMKAYNFNDGVNKISTFFYETDDQFMAVYYQFIKFLRTHFLKEPFWFQATPTIRIHCPNAENSHHYPRYHSDISYGHPPEEINLWMPLTEVMEGHGFRAMSVASSQQILETFQYDFAAMIQSAINDKAFSNHCDTFSPPVDTDFGKMVAFDSRCIHTGEPLKAHTRISMDIRILPLSQYDKMTIEYQGSGRRKILFTPGHCYHQFDSDHLLS